MCSLNNFQAVVDESNNVIFKDNQILVYNPTDDCTLYIPNNEETRAALNLRETTEDNEENLTVTADDTDQHEETQRWTHESTLLLLSLYEDHIGSFKSPKKTNKSVWLRIANEMSKRGYLFTGDQCDLKFRNLKKTYKRIKDNNKSSGRGAIVWPYMDMFERVFGSAPDINPKATVSTFATSLNTLKSANLSTDNHSVVSLPYLSPSTSSVGSPGSSTQVENSNESECPEPVRNKRRKMSNEEPAWVSTLRKEAKERHDEKMTMLRELIGLLKKE
ncbi:hypothetical protein PPYR_02267 [Photinus pyralis]|uniref:Myb/SANT-like DNA-binding domain-containing protein n=1 Tax=Photinus pyralis TaxID=7054 RepID=A0A5N4B6R6_PHOPY|nr:uncharacterized protein LOC116176429 [Photinus pyralis]XP_031351831.1 uncharacterized protein LOC116177078 isoform X3 [Photinus pyralis]KAB0805297.1 hypothetical protein PPYR_02267 [Photinus pyralis]